jgi:hypothetical protein
MALLFRSSLDSAARWRATARPAVPRARNPPVKAPEFTADTIKADPWTAVYLPIPPDADAALLQQVREAVTLCRETVEGPP